jgi:hypothetical protein
MSACNFSYVSYTVVQLNNSGMSYRMRPGKLGEQSRYGMYSYRVVCNAFKGTVQRDGSDLKYGSAKTIGLY